ncbi:MAG: cyclic nucleotide-binding domain-containing protein, partial [Candidatus Hydrogenedentes bacterium]|nr:cyclic nucleotide-binding domain-containing protein [Candidatus Hydrogenedentota bacterium]
DKLLESVFGTHKIPKDMSTEDVKEEESRKSPIAEEGTIESIMNSYTDVMVNSMHDTYELLARKISFFNGISPENVAKIFTQGNVVEYEPAQMLFDKGDTGNIMFVILNGRVKIRDEAKQIAILHTGDIFGEMGLVSDAPRSAAAITMIQSDLLRLSIEDILQDIPANVAAQLLVNIIITLAERLRVANQKQD